MPLPADRRAAGLVPAVLVPALVIAAQLAIWWSAQQFGSYDVIFELVPGIPYRAEPLLPTAIALILGITLFLYEDLGVAQAVVAVISMVTIPLVSGYVLTYVIATDVPVRISSVEEYSAAMFSAQATADGICWLVVLTACSRAFRSITVGLLLLACWSAPTVLAAWGLSNTPVAGLAPYLAPVTTVLGFAIVGLNFGQGRHDW